MQWLIQWLTNAMVDAMVVEPRQSEMFWPNKGTVPPFLYPKRGVL